MNVVVEEIGPCRKKLNIEIPPERVAEEQKNIVALYARSAKIPGFRPGRAPAGIVQRHYQKEIMEELNSQLLAAGYQEALKKESLRAVAVISVDEVKIQAGQPCTFSVVVDVEPKFDLPVYKGLSLKKKTIEITDQQVDASVEEIRDQAARYEEIKDRPVQREDMASIDYEGTCEGRPVEELAPEAKGLGQGKDFMVMVNEHAFLPGFAEGLTGLSIGDKKEIEVHFPEDFSAKPVAGKTAKYQVEVKSIRVRIKPELDEAFLKTLNMESVDALKKQVREDLARLQEEQDRNQLKDEIIKRLLESVPQDLPATEVQDEVKSMVYDVVSHNTRRGVSRELIEEKKDEIFKNADQGAREKVRVRYLLHRIAEAEGLSVTEQELGEELGRMALQYGASAQALREMLEKRDTLDQVRENMRMRKTTDFLLEQAVLTP